MTPEKNPWDAETVYALLQHVDEATYVRGIFSTKEKAQRAQNDLTGESKYEDDYEFEVKAFPLDAMKVKSR
jgi:hypothetical protein